MSISIPDATKNESADKQLECFYCRPTTYLEKKWENVQQIFTQIFTPRQAVECQVQLPSHCLSEDREEQKKKSVKFQTINKSYDFCAASDHKKWAPAKMKNALEKFLKREN